MKYKNYTIEFNSDARAFTFVHEDFDGAPDGNDTRSGHEKTEELCKQAIDEIELELAPELHEYYFTFGSGQMLKSGIDLRNFFVRVAAAGFFEARRLFIEHFTTIYCERPAAWSFQYDREDWTTAKPGRRSAESFFPGGEFAHVDEEGALTITLLARNNCKQSDCDQVGISYTNADGNEASIMFADIQLDRINPFENETLYSCCGAELDSDIMVCPTCKEHC